MYRRSRTVSRRHSAKVDEVDKEGNTIIVSGKMGFGPEARNHPRAPGYYSSSQVGQTSRAYFRPKPKPESDDKKKKTKKKKSAKASRPSLREEVVEIPPMAFFME